MIEEIIEPASLRGGRFPLEAQMLDVYQQGNTALKAGGGRIIAGAKSYELEIPRNFSSAQYKLFLEHDRIHSQLEYMRE